MRRGKTHVLKTWGDFGCFSRPELKTERFSYPCPTPSAARGIFDSIYCKAYDRCTKTAQFYWQIEMIELLNYPSYIALRRNEVSHTVASNRTINQWMTNPEKISPIIADDDKCRQPRQTMALRNPLFRIHAHVVARSGLKMRSRDLIDSLNGVPRTESFLPCQVWDAVNSLHFLNMLLMLIKRSRPLSSIRI